MSEHISSAVLSALVDGELPAEQVAAAKAHFQECTACASQAIDQWLLKTATANAGQRFEMPAQFQERMAKLVSGQTGPRDISNADKFASRRGSHWGAFSGWTAAAAILLIAVSVMFMQRNGSSSNTALAERTALITEASDLHIAALAASQPPEVISSDRHTVKPWFQGKLPFSFNIPENLPADTTLEGANLVYLHNRPVAQLLFSIGKHRVSVFVEQKNAIDAAGGLQTAHAGFQVMGFSTDDLEVIGVSDVDPARLAGLMHAIQDAQVTHSS